MKRPDLKGRKVLVVGLGLSGVASARFLLDQGAVVTATDNQPLSKFDREVTGLAEMGAVLELGGHQETSFTGSDLIVISPGVPLTLEPLQKALRKGVSVVGEVELASWFIKGRIVAVTGTNGKTTTTSLIGAMLERAGLKVFVGGNIGNPLINLVQSGLEVDAVVAEVSSFQLETVDSFHPSVALLLNLSPDHLDRYPGYADYIEAKRRIFSRQQPEDTAILNADDQFALESPTRARRLLFSRKKPVQDGAWLDRGRIIIGRAGMAIGSLSVEELALTGSHNQENVMAALLAAWAMGINPDSAVETARGFQGLPHRVEFVREINGVRYYDDSKGTNVGAVIKSLESFDSPVILIAGGRDKDSDFTLLQQSVQDKVKLLVLLGEAAGDIARALAGSAEMITVFDMAEAVAEAGRKASPGDVVLLSPACASFDMFRDYKHRGEVFSELVRQGGAD